MEEFIKSFHLEKMNTGASRLQPSEIENCNRLEFQRQINDPILCTKLIHKVRDVVMQSKFKE